MLDTAQFIDRAKMLYGYDNFVCDSSGSIVEVVNPEDRDDPVLAAVTDHLLPVWIEGTEAHTEELIRRFDRDPKPMYYQPDFLRSAWAEYRAMTGEAEDRSIPTLSCAGPMPAPSPTGSHAMRRLRETGA